MSSLTTYNGRSTKGAGANSLLDKLLGTWDCGYRQGDSSSQKRTNFEEGGHLLPGQYESTGPIRQSGRTRAILLYWAKYTSLKSLINATRADEAAFK